MSIFDEPKIDSHAHVLDPDRFAYGEGIYHPSGQEIGTVGQMRPMMECYGIRHTFLVQPNSGYGSDNACLIDAVASDRAAFRAAAILPLDASSETLAEMKARGVIGLAFNPTILGTEYYAACEPLLQRMADLDMILNLQIEHDQIDLFAPWIRALPIRVAVDHCGRPTPEEGTAQKGFSTLLDLAETGRVWVKLSGYPKFARQRFPFEDCWPFIEALKTAFGPERLLWSSDWPYLRAPDHQDVGPLVHLAGRLLPDPEARRKVFWDTPKALFGF